MAALSLAVWYMLSHRLQYSPGGHKKGLSQKDLGSAHHWYNRRVITPFSSKREMNHLASS